MKKSIPFLLLAVILSQPIIFANTASAQPNGNYNVKFPKNASSSSHKGKIKGYSYNDYTFYAKANQHLNVRANENVVITLFGTGISDSISLDKYSPDLQSNGDYILPATGSYTIRVSQMRNLARQRKSVGYTLNIAIK